METVWAILIVMSCGAAGGFVNVFLGDSGLHLPKVENGVFQPGFVGTVIVGALAAVGSWCTAKSLMLIGGSALHTFQTGDVANALMVGFGGAKWFKSEAEKNTLHKAAAVAAGKQSDPAAATNIAGATPSQALDIAMHMR